MLSNSALSQSSILKLCFLTRPTYQAIPTAILRRLSHKENIFQMIVSFTLCKLQLARNDNNKEEIEGIVASILESSKRVRSKID